MRLWPVGEGAWLRRLLLGSGALFLATLLVPWFGGWHSWDVVLSPEVSRFDRIWPLFLLGAGLSTIAAGLFLRGSRAAAVAAAVGTVGYGFWFFVDLQIPLWMWDGAWQLVVIVIGLLATAVGLLRRRQAIATVGAVALAAVLLAPAALQGGDRVLFAEITRTLARPQRLMWHQTAELLWWVVLALAAVAGVSLWAARSRLLERSVATTLIIWPGLLSAFAGILALMTVSREGVGIVLILPLLALEPFLLAALGALATLGTAALFPDENGTNEGAAGARRRGTAA